MASDHPVHASASQPFARGILIAVRLAFGYIVAVGAGAIIFSAINKVFDPYGNPDASAVLLSQWLNEVANNALMFFMLGLVFGLPYTIVGSLAFRYMLPRNGWSFMLTGIICPAAAIFIVGIGLGGTVWYDREFLRLGLMTLPSGLVATYLYGAIGFGFGFGRWRIE